MNKKLIRQRFRESVFCRDKNKCRICGRSDVKLDAHHITNRNLMPNGGYVLENGITLCNTENGCHFKAEINEIKPDTLYNLISSSFEKAFVASENL